MLQRYGVSVSGPHRLLGLLVAVIAVGIPAGAGAQSGPVPLTDAANSPLERAAFVALPAVYQVDVEVRVDALVAGSRRVKVNEVLRFGGTGFGVAPGWVVTARHVARPRARDVVDGVLEEALVSGLPADRSGIRPITRTRIFLTRARTEAVPLEVPERRPEPIRARLGPEDRSGDMALLTIADREAPTLPLYDDVRDGTPVATIGFGRGSDAVPAVQRGTLDGARTTRPGGDTRFGGLVDVDVAPGDSGGPALDSEGQVHGVVLRPATERDTPVVGRTQTILDLLGDRAGTAGANTSTSDFAAAMDAFWRREYGDAQRRLSALGTRYDDPALVALEERRASRLAIAPFRVSGPSRFRGALLALGAMAAFAAVAFGVLRLTARD